MSKGEKSLKIARFNHKQFEHYDKKKAKCEVLVFVLICKLSAIRRKKEVNDADL